jgi:hypothetical protein
MRRFSRLAPPLLGAYIFTACASPSAPTPVVAGPPLAGAPASNSQEEKEPVSEPAEEMATASVNAVPVRPRYYAIAVSGGFDRNDYYGSAWGTNFQGVINQAMSTCQRGSQFCEIAAWCTPPQLSPSRPYVAYARSSVYSRNFLDRGVGGFACGYSSLNAAISAAVGACSLSGCTLKDYARIY